MPKKNKRAIDALEEAQKIAFAPFVFQATVALRRLGIFNYIFNKRHEGGVTLEDMSEALTISAYGLSVLLEIAESSNIVYKQNDGCYELTKTGYFLNFNKTVEVNLNFTQDVCYKGLFHLTKAITTQQPQGLKEFGEWETIYEGLSQLPANVQKSWFEFDHHYSDEIFGEVLERVFMSQPQVVFDIGGNTGKFALQCLMYDPHVQIRIFDLPGQLNKALQNLKNKGFEDRVSGIEVNWLHDPIAVPTGADVIWMSQFLDCFSEETIVKILTTCVQAMSMDTELIIVEPFTDRQKFDNAKFSLEATSLYFTALANGTSKMYSAEVFMKLVKSSNLMVVEDHAVGDYHTMLICKKRD